MKLNIKWKSKLEVFDAVGSIESYMNNRNDIIELLNFINENGINKTKLINLFGDKAISDIVVERVISYLRDCGYIANGVLTTKGKNVLKDKLVPVEERGKFRFWNIEDLGPMKNMYPNGSKLIIGYRRQRDTGSKNIHRETLGDYKNLKVKMPNSNKAFKVLNLSDNNSSNGSFACIKLQNLTKDIDLNLELSSSNEISLNVKGNIQDMSEDNLKSDNNVVFEDQVVDKELSYFIVNMLKQCNYFVDYDSSNKSFKLSNVKELVKNKVISRESLSKFNSKFNIDSMIIDENVYDIEAKEIPIMPSNYEDAVYWYSEIIKKEVLKSYINEVDFENLLKELGMKKEFKNYITDINKENKLLAEEFKNSKNLRLHWNLQAPKDVRISSMSEELVFDKLDISIGTILSMRDLVNKLIGSSKVDKLIYSSKYIIKNDQKRKFEVFVEALKEKGCRDVLLVTQNKFESKGMDVLNYDEVYGNRKSWPHDRYFSIQINDIWHYYKMSAELDQCKYATENLEVWDSSLEGEWKDISFIRIDRSIFPEELLRLEDNR